MGLSKRKMVSAIMIWCLKVVSARMMIVFDNLIFWRRPAWVMKNLLVIFALVKRFWGI